MWQPNQLLPVPSLPFPDSQGRGFHPDEPGTPAPLRAEGERDWAQWVGFSDAPASGLSGARLVLPSQDSVPLGVGLPRVGGLPCALPAPRKCDP
jgi:hypothetical protein